MSQYRIGLLIGSLRQESINRQLANALTKMAPSSFTFHECRIDDLPCTTRTTTAIRPRR